MVRVAASRTEHRSRCRQIDRVVDNQPGGTRVYFNLVGRAFIAFDSPIRHAFDFTPSMSIFVRCDDADDVASLLDNLASGGDVKMPVDDYGFSSCFGWTTDRYGVSWQIGVADRELAHP